MTDERLIELVDNADDVFGRPFVTSKNIAEEVGISRQAVHQRLQRFADEGRIQKYKPGPAAIWWSED